VQVAANLLATQGPDAVTTRSVALAAGLQAPAIYRLFGDKNGLLDAVVEHGFATYLSNKPPVGTNADDADPIAGLRAGWELHVGFGLANPGLFRLMLTALRTPDGQAIAAAGEEILRARVHRVAAAGRLRVTERRAVDLIRAAGTGVVFTLIDQPEAERDEALADTAWESVCAAILTDPATTAIPGPAAAAVTLRAALPGLTTLTPAERALLADWLDRIAGSLQGHVGAAEASLDGRDELLRNRSQRRDPGLIAATAATERRAVDHLVGRAVAAEQPGVGDVLDVLQRGTQRSGVIPGLADRGGDRGRADLRPGRVVPVSLPRHAVHVQTGCSGQHAAEILQYVHVPDGNPQRHRGGQLPAPLHLHRLLIVVELLPSGPGMRRPRQRAAARGCIERHRAQRG
jgi:AcrR family transcriptional regulator